MNGELRVLHNTETDECVLRSDISFRPEGGESAARLIAAIVTPIPEGPEGLALIDAQLQLLDQRMHHLKTRRLWAEPYCRCLHHSERPPEREIVLTPGINGTVHVVCSVCKLPVDAQSHPTVDATPPAAG